jgi:5,10-methylene-tetrahydrofolate dehydrogenase/methenyl tetrahydrofolate cyclohydrolase
VQLPLPDSSIEREIIEVLEPAKDGDSDSIRRNVGAWCSACRAFVP